VPPPPPVAPAKKKRKWPWVVGGLVLVIIIGSAANGGGTSGSAPTIAGANLPAAAVPAADSPAAPAAPEPPPTPIVHEGKGDDVVTLQKPDGVAVLDFDCSRCSSNVVLKTDGSETLLVNEIGKYKGRHLIDASSTSATSTLTVNAAGSWKITVTPGLSALRSSTGEPFSGEGDDVVVLNGSAKKIAIENRGDSNFVVKAVGGAFPNLLVNEIGSYKGTVPVSTPAALVITSGGKWTITPS
jgi:hypothetical protein